MTNSDKKGLLIIKKVDFPPRTGSTASLEYYKNFKKYFRVRVFCPSKRTDNVEIISARLNIKNEFLKDLIFSVKSALLIISKGRSFSIIYVMNPLRFACIAIIIARVFKKTVIYDIRTAPIKEKGVKYKAILLFEKLSLMLSNKIVVINWGLLKQLNYQKFSKKTIESSLGYSQKNLEAKKIVDLRKKYNIVDDHKLFIYLGSLDKKRGISNVIKAFNNLNEAHLFILGRGNDENDLKNIAKPNIHFLGLVAYEEIFNFILACDIGISYVPKKEVYQYLPPLKTIEYLGAGLGVLATNTAGNKIFIQDRINGILSSDSSEEFIKNVKKISNMKFDRGKIKLTAKKYSWENICYRLLGNLGII